MNKVEYLRSDLGEPEKANTRTRYWVGYHDGQLLRYLIKCSPRCLPQSIIFCPSMVKSSSMGSTSLSGRSCENIAHQRSSRSETGGISCRPERRWCQVPSGKEGGSHKIVAEAAAGGRVSLRSHQAADPAHSPFSMLFLGTQKVLSKQRSSNKTSSVYVEGRRLPRWCCHDGGGRTFLAALKSPPRVQSLEMNSDSLLLNVLFFQRHFNLHEC